MTRTKDNRSFWQSSLFQVIVMILLALAGSLFAYGKLTKQQEITNKEVISIKSEFDKKLSYQHNFLTNQIKISSSKQDELTMLSSKHSTEIALLGQSLSEQSRRIEEAYKRFSDRIDESRRENSKYRQEIREDIRALRDNIGH